MLVGPNSNPANLIDSDDIHDMFNKIVTSGNDDVTVSVKPILIADFFTTASLDTSRYKRSSSNSVLVSIRQECHKY